jgi:hypothetical protein
MICPMIVMQRIASLTFRPTIWKGGTDSGKGLGWNEQGTNGIFGRRNGGQYLIENLQ